ncbi:hypothetical protein D3C87_2039470 [compost metagenome]
MGDHEVEVVAEPALAREVHGWRVTDVVFFKPRLHVLQEETLHLASRQHEQVVDGHHGLNQ